MQLQRNSDLIKSAWRKAGLDKIFDQDTQIAAMELYAQGKLFTANEDVQTESDPECYDSEDSDDATAIGSLAAGLDHLSVQHEVRTLPPIAPQPLTMLWTWAQLLLTGIPLPHGGAERGEGAGEEEEERVLIEADCGTMGGG